jgi:hypothetical protein
MQSRRARLPKIPRRLGLYRLDTDAVRGAPMSFLLIDDGLCPRGNPTLSLDDVRTTSAQNERLGGHEP